ncbi:MAG: type II toxin-antitoxin system Phd/YefM family antitoxin [Spirochaetales bacterium]|nr:type II toxin-antitoxin system Phd/YefM family antitoxin [Spirochaetales bacterium]
MKYSESVKPISYFKAHASEVINRISENRDTMIITQNGEARVVLQDIKVFEEFQESLALLKILALGNNDYVEGRVSSLDESFSRIRASLKETP